MRRAVWRASPDDPKGRFRVLVRWMRELARGLDVGDTSRTILTLAFVVAFSALPVAALYAALALLDGWALGDWTGWLAGFAALIATMVFAGGAYNWLWRRPLGALDRLLPLPLPQGTFPVHVAVRYRGSPIGADEAAASFVDGWLYVDGARTSFSLRYGDGRSEWGKGRLKIELPGETSVVVRPAGNLGIEPDGRGFEDAARRWVGEGHRPPGESVLPPLDVHPLMRKGWTLGLLCGCVVGSAAFALLDALHLGSWRVVPMLFATLLAARAILVASDYTAADDRAKALADPAEGLRLP